MNTKTNNKEHDFFDKLSKEWWDEDGKFSVLHKIRPLRIRYILDQLNNKNIVEAEILDLGCGGGLVSESLAKLGAVVTGVDFVKENIKIANDHASKNNLNINYINQNIEKLKIKKKFDVIIMFEILEHLDDWKVFIMKIKKNLKKNGILIISTINRNVISKISAIYIAENILKWIPKGTHEFNKFIKPSEIHTCLKNNNFKFKDITGLEFSLLDYEWKLTNNTNINYFCTYEYN